ncbi:FAD/NAD(P)-binding domain-containing protein [Punctularia strigosozonata HHB-11173 SS5]|uniref:FAD/NAD(P)-binding domain-containing protein n=1 Tax=Punctularia strigosozonata (strain HHB-11173) TaxID=741275 RepID=UPI0004417AA0|nr:FAD/NAD(P)-binding domain-containing protein [Punctularia strigosozonata HHB-11173 SS5]EIN10544.1 FAD/NAD(P)-binding domain-containing protein [Punctularia strigosozonata HHB-11173 SS5]
MWYILIQRIIVAIFKPTPPKSADPLPNPRGRVAVIGAGLTGVSSAAHAIAHGFEVVIYDSNDRVGGIWSHVNSTSGLQLNSLIYRFHPAVVWSKSFPHRDEILGEIERIWKEYKLESRTKLKTKVIKIERASPKQCNVSEDDADPQKLGHARWLINDGSDGPFDAVIVTVGTCGEPMRVGFPGMPKSEGADNEKESHEETFGGPVIHSSELDEIELSGKNVVVIGSGASGVEAVETALSKAAKHAVIVARDDKWIIPRNIVVDTSISAQPFGREMPLSILWETFLRKWHYYGVEDLSPAHRGIYEGTPIVNDEFLDHVRQGRCDYIRGDTKRLTSSGVLVNVRGRQSKPNDPGEEKVIDADLVVLATGFKKPDVDFLPSDLFPEGYERPNLYLQNFSTEDWSVLMTNSSYVNAIGTVGHFHIGIYTRILLTLLMDKDARPTPKDMKLWVDVIRFVKRGAAGGALSFFTYMELTIWLVLFHLFRPDRLKWMFFILNGWGVHPLP